MLFLSHRTPVRRLSSFVSRIILRWISLVLSRGRYYAGYRPTSSCSSCKRYYAGYRSTSFFFRFRCYLRMILRRIPTDFTGDFRRSFAFASSYLLLVLLLSHGTLLYDDYPFLLLRFDSVRWTLTKLCWDRRECITSYDVKHGCSCNCFC